MDTCLCLRERLLVSDFNHILRVFASAAVGIITWASPARNSLLVLVADSHQCQRSSVSFERPQSANFLVKKVDRVGAHCDALQCPAWHCALALLPVRQTLDSLRSLAFWCIFGAVLGTPLNHVLFHYVSTLTINTVDLGHNTRERDLSCKQA